MKHETSTFVPRNVRSVRARARTYVSFGRERIDPARLPARIASTSLSNQHDSPEGSAFPTILHCRCKSSLRDKRQSDSLGAEKRFRDFLGLCAIPLSLPLSRFLALSLSPFLPVSAITRPLSVAARDFVCREILFPRCSTRSKCKLSSSSSLPSSPFPLGNSWHRVGASGSRERGTLCACMRDLFPAIWIYGGIEEERRSRFGLARVPGPLLSPNFSRISSLSLPPPRDRVRSFRAFLVFRARPEE